MEFKVGKVAEMANTFDGINRNRLEFKGESPLDVFGYYPPVLIGTDWNLKLLRTSLQSTRKPVY